MNQVVRMVPRARPRRALDATTNARLQASYRQRDKGDRQFVEALARGLAILRCFRATDHSLGNQEIARRTGLPKPTVSRLTHTLTQMGFLQPTQHDEYALGVGVLALGHAYLASLNVRDVARPLMQEFADFAKATVSLGEADGQRMVVLEICHGSPTYRLRLDIGERVPHNTTALGRAYIAGMSEERRRQCIAGLTERQPAEMRAEFANSLRDSLRDHDKYGFVFSFGDWKEDIFACGVPLVSADGRRIFSLSCSGPVFDMTRKRLMAEIGPRMVQLRDRILEATHGVF
ncbi:MAG TPA: IclR family transcriptional regulator [Steroidobacteraceae bacterium]|jgi:DNA-binding IclR family transcriptional regulator|nr:IclR family transcriptional regulator [Steroidobacteraceae bacterium]